MTRFILFKYYNNNATKGLSFNVFNLSGAATCPISFLLQTPQILDFVSYSVLSSRIFLFFKA